MVDRLSRGWLWFVAVMAAPILLLSFRSFPLVTTAYALPAFVAFSRAPRMLPLPGWAIALGCLAAYSLLSGLWTPQGGVADWIWWQPALFFVGLAVFHRPPPPIHMLTIGLSAALVLLFVDAITGSGLRAVLPPENRPDKDAVATARGLGILLMMMPFLAVALWQRVGAIYGMAAAAGFVVAAVFTPVDANVLAACAAIAAGGAALWRPQDALRLVTAFAGVAFTMPFVLALTLPPVPVLANLALLPPSSVQRLVIWRSVLDEWLSGQPLFGAGARATRALGREIGTVELTAYGIEVSQVSVHPHNIPIEILYEYGLVGYGFVLAAFVLGAKTLLARAWGREAAVAMAALLAIMVTIFSIQTTTWNVYFTSATLLTAYALYGLFGERSA